MKQHQIEKLLYLFIILNPILDLISGISNEFLNLSISYSAILRPLIPIALILYLFFLQKEIRLRLVIVGIIYGVYAAIHLYLFHTHRNSFFFGTTRQELQYLVNYTYLIVNIILYYIVFYRKQNELRKYLFYANILVVGSIWFAIITQTSLHTYLTGEGFRGYFQAGGPIGSYLTISMFVLVPYLIETRSKQIVLKVIYLLSTIMYLTFFLGTRVGLLGVMSVFGALAFSAVFIAIVKGGKNSLRIAVVSVLATVILVGAVAFFGAEALNRRHIIENETHDSIHLDLDLNDLISRIETGEYIPMDLSDAQVKALFSLRDKVNELKLPNSDYRRQQLIYQSYLWKYQNEPLLYLFGNGFLNSFGMLLLEMEPIAIFFNGGILGFILFTLPFIIMIGYAFIFMMKHIKKVTLPCLMYFFGCIFSLMIATLSGRVYFHVTVIPALVVIYILLLNEVYVLKKGDLNE